MRIGYRLIAGIAGISAADEAAMARYFFAWDENRPPKEQAGKEFANDLEANKYAENIAAELTYNHHGVELYPRMGVFDAKGKRVSC